MWAKKGFERYDGMVIFQPPFFPIVRLIDPGLWGEKLMSGSRCWPWNAMFLHRGYASVLPKTSPEQPGLQADSSGSQAQETVRMVGVGGGGIG